MCQRPVRRFPAVGHAPSRVSREASRRRGWRGCVECGRVDDPESWSLRRPQPIRPESARSRSTQKKLHFVSNSSRNRFLSTISAGDRGDASSQRSKSWTRTVCSTSGAFTVTVTAVWPRPMSSTHSLSRKIRSACATASYTLPALTSTVCPTPARSEHETLHVFRATRLT